MKMEYGSNSISITQSSLEMYLTPLLQEVKLALHARSKKDIIIQLGKELLERIAQPYEICGWIKYILRNEISDNISLAGPSRFLVREILKNKQDH